MQRKNILFLLLTCIDINQKNLYVDMIKELDAQQNNVFVVCATPRRNKVCTHVENHKQISILYVNTLNTTGKVSIFEKGLGILKIQSDFEKNIEKFFKQIKFDLILYSTPPITFAGVIEKIKKRDNAQTYLLLKDIFPQNAIDIGLLKENSMLHKFFQKKEKSLYNISDHIGCMSEKNCEFLLEKNPYINKTKVEICPNSIYPSSSEQTKALKSQREQTLKKLEIPKQAVVFIYGGNLGIPQGVDFFLETIETQKERKDVFFLIIGSGSQYQKIESFFQKNKIKNAKLLSYVPKNQYDQILASCDVGMIFLDKRFTIPNIPSRMNAYLDLGLPLLAATDKNTDLKQIIQSANCGLWSESGDVAAFLKNVDKLVFSKQIRELYGQNARKLLLKNYNIKDACNTVVGHLKNLKERDYV